MPVSVPLSVDILDGGDIDDLDLGLGLLVLHWLLVLSGGRNGSGIDLELFGIGILDRSGRRRRRHGLFR